MGYELVGLRLDSENPCGCKTYVGIWEHDMWSSHTRGEGYETYHCKKHGPNEWITNNTYWYGEYIFKENDVKEEEKECGCFLIKEIKGEKEKDIYNYYKCEFHIKNPYYTHEQYDTKEKQEKYYEEERLKEIEREKERKIEDEKRRLENIEYEKRYKKVREEVSQQRLISEPLLMEKFNNMEKFAKDAKSKTAKSFMKIMQEKYQCTIDRRKDYYDIIIEEKWFKLKTTCSFFRSIDNKNIFKFYMGKYEICEIPDVYKKELVNKL